MTTGVQKQEAFRQNFGIGFRCRCVVDDGTVWSVSGNGLKGQIEEAILFGTELPQLFCRTEFGLMRCLCSNILNPLDEFHHCNRIFLMRIEGALDFGLILNGLHHSDWSSFIHRLHAFRNSQAQSVVRGTGIQPQCLGCIQSGNVLFDFVISFHGNEGQVFRQGILYRTVHYVQVHRILGKQDEGEEYRCIIDITASHVQEPCVFHQIGNQQVIRILFGHGLPNVCNLFGCGLAGSGQRQFVDFRWLNLRTGSPYFTDQVFVPFNGHAQFTQLRLKLFTVISRNNLAVKSQRIATFFLCQVNQEFFNSRNARLCHSHQLNFAAGQLTLCLEEISAVGPKISTFVIDDELTGFSGQSAHEFTSFKEIVYILGTVIVTGWYVVNIHTIGFHLFPKL